MPLHPIQKHILKLLAHQEDGLPYSELKPHGVEGNQFSYHIRNLERKGYVTHRDKSYVLTTIGIRFLSGLNFEHFFVRLQAKITTLIVCENESGELLVYNRKRHPFLSQIGFPYGKAHLGEPILDAADRELLEKTGYQAALTHKGMAYILVTDPQGEIIVHMLCHIFYSKKVKLVGSPSKAWEGLDLRWVSKKQFLSSPLMPGAKDVLRIATSKKAGLVFEELTFQVPE